MPRVAQGHGDQSVWELGGAASVSWGGPGEAQFGSFQLPVRYFLFDGADLGLEARYWPSGSYPLSSDTSSVFAGGVNGRMFFVNQSRLGAYVGGAMLWVPAHTQFVLSPEVGIRYFVSKNIAMGAFYEIVTDLGSYLLSLQPTASSVSTQSLGLNIALEI